MPYYNKPLTFLKSMVNFLILAMILIAVWICETAEKWLKKGKGND
jgi:large-conductance mechanosensitive channel